MTKESLVDRLKQLDACALSDALDQMGMKGVALGLHPMWPCGKIAGQVVTCRLGVAGMTTNTRHLGTSAIEYASSGDVIVVDHSGRTEMAGWGGLLSLAAKTKGLGGVIVDGACRDVDESAVLGFPVYARTAVPITARGRVVEVSFNEPVEIDGLLVKPGDFVLADGSGIVFIDGESAEQVIEKAEKIASKERKMAELVSSGIPVTEVMGLQYETMLNPGEEK